MHIGMINKKYYDGYEGYDYIAFKIKEDSNTALIVWDGYIDSIFENQDEWNSGFSLDWCELKGPFENEEVDSKVDIKSYYTDLCNLNQNNFSERLFSKNDLLEFYNSLKEFFKYIMDNNFTLIVNVGTNF